MGWYRTGTVAVTNGGMTVTGVGTSWVDSAAIGWAFVGPDGRTYEIASITSATSITLASAYAGASASGQAYAIMPTMGAAVTLAAQVAALIGTYEGVASAAGQGKFGDGTVTAPGIRFSADLDTGIYRPGANQLAGSEGGVSIGRLYGRSNIVGAVSRAAGVPTGAVIETGSNANGEYTRWADGTQICWHVITAADLASDTTQSGTWVFPAAFVSTPVAFAHAPAIANPHLCWGACLPISATTANTSIRHGLGTPSTRAMYVTTIGRWY